MSDHRLGRSRKVSVPQGGDPRDRSSIGDSLTADMLGPGLELVGRKIQLKISPTSPLYTEENGDVNFRAGSGTVVAPGSPMSLQVVPADASMEVTPKGVRARPTSTQVRNESGFAGRTVTEALATAKTVIDALVATPPAVFTGLGAGNGQVRDTGGSAVGSSLADNGLFNQLPGHSKVPTASVTIPANFDVCMSREFTLNSGIALTIASGGSLRLL